MRSLAELVPRLPGPVRSVLRNAVWTYGTATARLRPLPDFLILGAQKAGTTALYEYLRRHPGIEGPRWKEVSYFDRHYARGPAWYRGNFPLQLTGAGNGRRLVGEASPSYLFHPLAPERAAALVPGARLIAILRDPVERAYSHYQHEVSFGREPLSVEEAIDREEARMEGELERMLADPAYFSHAWWDFTYLARGLYAEQLERWRAAFRPTQLLVLANEELSAEPAATYGRVLSFLGAAPHELEDYPRVFDRDYPDMRPATRERLVAHFADPNRRLYELLGRDLGWASTI